MVFNCKRNPTLNQKGFTLIELLISVAILILIFSFGPFITIGALRDYQISQEADYLVSNLRLVQQLSLQQKNDSFFGIKFAKNTYSLFRTTSLEDEIEIFRSHPLPKGYQINGPKKVIFEKMTGKPLWNGIIGILEVTKDGVVLHKKEININPEGNIEVLQ